jgi:hypothetical protein
MNIVKKVGLFILGITVSVSAQWVGLPLTIALRIPDPALTILYSFIGILISIAFVVYFGWKKNWLFVSGVVIGIPFWWFFMLMWMTVTGTWL